MIISPVHFPSYRFWPRRKRGDTFFGQGLYFERASWAIAYGIMGIAKKRGKSKARVWFPDYFCKEPLEILSNFPIEVEHYSIGKNFEPDWEALEQMCAQRGSPDAMVVVHYFGFSNNSKTAQKFCERHSTELIEDCAHVMEAYDTVGSSGTFAVFSPWKFFPIPFLGFLRAGENFRALVRSFSPRRDTFFGMGWVIKREMQRALSTLGVNWYARTISRSLCPSSSPKEELDMRASYHAISLRLFSEYCKQTDYIRQRRVENYESLIKFFRKTYPTMLLFDSLPDGAVPYMFPCVARDSAAKLVGKLMQRGIPATQWPELPADVAQNTKQFPWAHFYAKHLILLPIHHNVSPRQIEYMQTQIKALVR